MKQQVKRLQNNRRTYKWQNLMEQSESQKKIPSVVINRKNL